MDNYGFTRWCRRATAKIKFPPDRDAVAKELQQHLEDHYDALIAQGATHEEATAQAIAAMGSAEVIAPQLAAVHKPFWGYAARVTGFIAFFLLVCAIWFAGMSLVNRTITRDEPEYFTETELHYETRIFYDTPGTVIAAGDRYLFLINKAAVWEPKYISEGDTLSACVQIKVFRWPHLDTFDGLEYFYAVDDLGTIYQPPYNDDRDHPRLSYGNVAYFPASQTFNLDVYGIPTQGIGWLELRYDRDGRDIAIRIDLTGGEGA